MWFFLSDGLSSEWAAQSGAAVSVNCLTALVVSGQLKAGPLQVWICLTDQKESDQCNATMYAIRSWGRNSVALGQKSIYAQVHERRFHRFKLPSPRPPPPLYIFFIIYILQFTIILNTVTLYCVQSLPFDFLFCFVCFLNRSQRTHGLCSKYFRVFLKPLRMNWECLSSLRKVLIIFPMNWD